MGKHSDIFKYVMLIYAFAFVAALTFDTDRSISAWKGGAAARTKQAERTLSPRSGQANVKDALGAVPSPAPAAEKDI